MKSIECSEVIRAPVDLVFRVATDLRNAPAWSSQIRKLEVLTPGPISAGTRFRETRVMFGKEATEEMEITSLTPNRSYTVECNNHGCHYKTVLDFSESGGATKVTMRFGATAHTLFARVMGFLTGPLLKGFMVKCLQQDLADLKKHCEGDATRANPR